MANTYICTFGHGHILEHHHIEIVAKDYEQAQAKVYQLVGNKYSTIYTDAKEFYKSQDEMCKDIGEWARSKLWRCYELDEYEII